MTKRGKLEIIKDILRIIQKSNGLIKPTPLLRKSGISSASFKEYYTELLQKELIKEKTNPQGKYINLTEKGFRFIERYKTIISFIEEFDL